MLRSLVGRPAPSFSLPDAAGEMRDGREWSGLWRLFVFHRHLG